MATHWAHSPGLSVQVRASLPILMAILLTSPSLGSHEPNDCDKYAICKKVVCEGVCITENEKRMFALCMSG